jgi:hypothetical protein
MTRPYRDISAERRERAAACVSRHLGALTALLEAHGLAHRIVEGSAVAAEVFLAESNTLHTAVRVGVLVGAGDLPLVERSLRRAGFRPGDPVGDSTLLRLASRNGRRAVHVLLEGGGLDGREPAAKSRHPADPAAARARAARLRTAWLDLAAVYRRVHYETRPDHDVTESFEVQLIDLPARAR